MTKVRVQDATKELSTNTGKMLESITQMRKKTQDMLGNLRKISGEFAREAQENAEREAREEQKKRYEAVREDPYYNALQLKYANAITCHKSQGGQWSCVFIDNPFWQDELTVDDLKWLYTALTRATAKVYLVNFKDEYFA